MDADIGGKIIVFLFPINYNKVIQMSYRCHTNIVCERGDIMSSVIAPFASKVHVAYFKGKAIAHMVAPFRFYPMDIPAADILIDQSLFLPDGCASMRFFTRLSK